MRVYEISKANHITDEVQMECKRAGTLLCLELKCNQLESMNCKASILERSAI